MGQLISYCKTPDGESISCDDNCDYSTINLNCVKIENYVQEEKCENSEN